MKEGGGKELEGEMPLQSDFVEPGGPGGEGKRSRAVV